LGKGDLKARPVPDVLSAISRYYPFMKFPIFALLFFSFVLPAQAGTKWVTPDFAILSVSKRSQSYSLPQVTDSNCRSAIEQIVCLVEPSKGDEPDYNRACLDGSKAYIKAFEDLHDELPGYLQKMFCHLTKIYIEKDFIGSAYAGLVREGDQENGPILGGILGVRQSLLDHPYSLDEWAGWKEQLHFGTSADTVQVAAGLPTVHSIVPGTQLGMLYFLVAHEFGHIFDFTNALNAGGSWQALSWKTDNVPLDEFEFSLRKELCFYFCDGKFIPGERQDELYEALAKTNFISAYATRYSAEDFADSFAYYVLMTERNAVYQVVTASGLVYDPIERLRRNPLMASKKRYLAGFLESDYKYPLDSKRWLGGKQ
jgi:hypothetical protein